MKTALLFCSLLLSLLCNGQNIITFTYDNSGNMVQRQVQVVPPQPGAKFVNPFSQTPEMNDSLNVVQFQVFPNPTREELNIEGKLPQGIEQAEILFYNTSGQILYKSFYVGEAKQVQLPGLKAGLYYLEIKYSQKSSSNYKIIITN